MKYSRSWRFALFVAVLFTFGSVGLSLAQEGPLELSDLGQLVQLRHPSISRDGQSIALISVRTNYEENREDHSLELVDLATGKRRDLTPERPGVGENQDTHDFSG